MYPISMEPDSIAAMIVGPSANSTRLTLRPSSSKAPVSIAAITEQRDA